MSSVGPDLTTIRQRAEETLEWISDFEAGLFEVRCHKCWHGKPYLPPEFFGLVESDERGARDVLALADEVERLRKALEMIAAEDEGDEYDVPKWRDVEALGPREFRAPAVARAAVTATPDLGSEAVSPTKGTEP